jgi:hypothetical protein
VQTVAALIAAIKAQPRNHYNYDRSAASRRRPVINCFRFDIF